MKPKQKTYTNRRAVKMELREVIDTSKGAAKHNGGPLHPYPLEPGDSVELHPRPGIRRVWRRWRP